MTPVIRRTVSRLRTLMRRAEQDRRLAEELETHLAMQSEDNVSAGMSAQDARRHALLSSGGLQQATEAFRDQQRLPLIETTLHDNDAIRFHVEIFLQNLRRSTRAALSVPRPLTLREPLGARRR